jgi:hypothetical protein
MGNKGGNMIQVKKLSLMSLALPMMLGLQGCDDRDLAIGLGAVAIGVGAIAIGSSVHHHSCGVSQRCTSWYDRRGYQHTQCRDYYDRCYQYDNMAYRPEENFDVMTLLASAPQESQNELTTNFASELNISFESADTLLQAFEQAKVGNTEGFVKLGLSTADMQAMAKFQLPTAKGLSALSANLDLSLDNTRQALTQFATTVKEQVRSSDSLYWRACYASKFWKTDRREGCRTGFERGCNPETGANYCLAI